MELAHVQFLIDTLSDSPAELRAAARMILESADARSVPAETFLAPPAPPAPPKLLAFSVDSAAPPGPAAPPAPPAPSAPPAVMLASDENGDDVEVEIDDAGNITALTTRIELPESAFTAPTVAFPAAPLPPTPVLYDGPKPAPLPPATLAAPGPAVSAELDTRGLPWDSRIHASNRAKKINGTWKNKRGVSQDLVTACEAQNKPGNVPTSNVSTTAGPVPPTAPAIASPATTTAPPAAPIAPTAPPPPSPMAGVAVQVAAAPSAIDFRGLMQKIQKATADGKLTADQVNAALAGVGLKPEEMAALINNAPLIASVNAAVDVCL